MSTIISPSEISITSTTIREDADLSLDEYLNEKVGQSTALNVVERPNSSLKDETNTIIVTQLQSEIEELKRKSRNEQQNPSAQTKQILEGFQEKILAKQTYEQQFKELSKQIKAVDYDNIQLTLLNCLFANFKYIINYLKSKSQINDYFVQIPSIKVVDQAKSSCISLIGVQSHHEEFKIVLRRIQIFSNLIQSAQNYYQEQLNQISRSIDQTMTNVICSRSDWKSYRKSFQQLIDEKIREFLSLFNKYILKESKTIVEEYLSDSSFQPWIQLKKLTERYTKKKQFQPELEMLKHAALEQFIKEHLLTERTIFERKPSNKSLQTLMEFLQQIKKEFQTNPTYHGCQIQQFKSIPHLLQRILLYYRCFCLQLPLFQSTKELLDIIDKNTVITISTATGSGKSSLIPALLIAEGYEKVIVTQPHRLACQSICHRVNETMRINKDQMKLAGWTGCGAQRHVNCPILYVTENLLKERLLYDENFIPTQMKSTKSIVFILDEVHERSIHMDLCLALFARLLTEKADVRSKIKVIISSATLDPSISKLFRQIPQIKFSEFQPSMAETLYPVNKFSRSNVNLLDIIQELCQKRERNDQILCFVSSVSEVHQYCRLLKDLTRGTIVPCPLLQSQPVRNQQRNIEHGTIFFTTDLAQTSLTFPSLRYIIDTGMIYLPQYDLNKKQTVLMKSQVAEAIIKQRLGRLGRTQAGEYYSLYDFKVEAKKYPTAQIHQIELIHLEFLLRKSQIKHGLSYLNKYLPDPLTLPAINGTIEELKRLNIIDAGNQLTSVGIALSQLPDFGSIAMSKSVLSALNDNKCGRDLIVLSSILNVLSTSSIFQFIPDSMKRSEGDLMTLLNLFNDFLLIRESVRAEQFQLANICEAKHLMSIFHIMKQSMRRYENFERSFNLSDQYREKAHLASHQWKLIAKSLLIGYGENVFLSMKQLQGKTDLFNRYSSSFRKDIARLDLHSTLSRSQTSTPVSLVIARDIHFSSSPETPAVLAFVGEIQSHWIEYRLTRQMSLNETEEKRLTSKNILTMIKQTCPNLQIQLNKHQLLLEGLANEVLYAELNILQQLIFETNFKLANKISTKSTTDYERMQRNLEGVSKMPQIFNPMIWRWNTRRQMKISVNSNTTTSECDIMIEGRDLQNRDVLRELGSFLGWLTTCAVIRHPNAGVPPRILKPQMRKICLDIEEKISHVTDSKRTSMELWESLTGSKATRETRMEVVAWIAVCQFDCRLEGGFVRDWIVGNYTGRPSGNPSTWICYDTNKAGEQIPSMKKDLIPSDLDCHLPLHIYFDIDSFLHYLKKYRIDCKVSRENWRYVLLFDENSPLGAFTMDLIEPHVALTHDRIDFDVSDLSLEKDYTKEIGMRVDIQNKPYSIELEMIVDNIKHKRFRVLRPIDDIVKERIDKMQSRGWSQHGQPLSVIPDPPPNYHAVLVPLPESTPLYKSLVQQMTFSIGNQVQVLSIEQIRNPLVEDAYISMRQLIAKQCSGENPNERELYHGTSGEAIDGILNNGFENRYWGTKYSKGNWGYGAYFADNPLISHRFTVPDSKDKTRVMYYNKVLLGNEMILQEINKELMSAPKDHHSIHGKFPEHPDSDEYIVYCYGQALPYLKVIYKA